MLPELVTLAGLTLSCETNSIDGVSQCIEQCIENIFTHSGNFDDTTAQ